MRSKRRVCIALLLTALAAGLSAQTAQMIDALLETEAVSFQTACEVVLTAAGLVGESGAGAADAAYRKAREIGALPEAAEPAAAIRLGELSFLIMKAFDMKSGFLYALFPGPRYAWRELVYRKIVQGRNDPSLTVSGERLLLILGRALDYTGADS